ncbi:MAG: hypothetical protein LBQ48_06615 [Oscillospiraceae bacterium]|nr:hypothetical protein [Oscillospiraceae bacterium]
MNRIVQNGALAPGVLERIKRHSAGTENQKSRLIKCHYCGHNSIRLFEDFRDHVQIKCSACGNESIYNAVLCRNGKVEFTLLRL